MFLRVPLCCYHVPSYSNRIPSWYKVHVLHIPTFCNEVPSCFEHVPFSGHKKEGIRHCTRVCIHLVRKSLAIKTNILSGDAIFWFQPDIWANKFVMCGFYSSSNSLKVGLWTLARCRPSVTRPLCLFTGLRTWPRISS